ncbi:MAG: hypothetical protein GY904_33585 [Planctomycetaceae bacterium]|nr:hypothetical protein [Planctomycetaceae bacterium]
MSRRNQGFSNKKFTSDDFDLVPFKQSGLPHADTGSRISCRDIASSGELLLKSAAVWFQARDRESVFRRCRSEAFASIRQILNRYVDSPCMCQRQLAAAAETEGD